MNLILAIVCLGLLLIILLFAGQKFNISSIVIILVIGMLAGLRCCPQGKSSRRSSYYFLW